MIPHTIELPRHIDSRGMLIVCEGKRDVYFPITRALWIVGAPRPARRGGYAHKTCHQFIVALSGSVNVECTTQTHTLSHPFIGLHVPPGNQFTLTNFSPNSVILILCSHPHDKRDYMYTHNITLAYPTHARKPRFWIELDSHYKSICFGWLVFSWSTDTDKRWWKTISISTI